MRIKGRHPRYPEDVRRIQQVVWNKLMEPCSQLEAETLWDMYSDSMAAGWIYLNRMRKFGIVLLIILTKVLRLAR